MASAFRLADPNSTGNERAFVLEAAPQSLDGRIHDGGGQGSGEIDDDDGVNGRQNGTDLPAHRPRAGDEDRPFQKAPLTRSPIWPLDEEGGQRPQGSIAAAAEPRLPARLPLQHDSGLVTTATGGWATVAMAAAPRARVPSAGAGAFLDGAQDAGAGASAALSAAASWPDGGGGGPAKQRAELARADPPRSFSEALLVDVQVGYCIGDITGSHLSQKGVGPATSPA